MRQLSVGVAGLSVTAIDFPCDLVRGNTQPNGGGRDRDQLTVDAHAATVTSPIKVTAINVFVGDACPTTTGTIFRLDDARMTFVVLKAPKRSARRRLYINGVAFPMETGKGPPANAMNTADVTNQTRA